jgi:hypothetical protein
MADEIVRDDPALAPPRRAVTGILERISWGAVWAGVMVALGMEVLFTLFGFFIGFGMYNWRAANPWAGISAWTTVWFLVTAGWSMFFGAWCAARLSGNPLAGDGILHGITTWGLATAATIAIVSVASWAILREGINVLATAAMTAEQVVPAAVNHIPPAQVSQAAQQAGQAVSQMQANAGPMAQATATIISGLSLRIFGGVLLGFITALLGGWLGRSRTIVMSPTETVPIPTRRAA